MAEAEEPARPDCWVLVRADNGYPLLVYGPERGEEARRMAEANKEKAVPAVFVRPAGKTVF